MKTTQTLLSVFSILALLTGCLMVDKQDGAGGGGDGGGTSGDGAEALSAGLTALSSSDLPTARDAFASSHDAVDHSPQAAFGLAITRLLTLVDTEEGRAVLSYLGRSPLSSDMIFGAGGMFRRLAAGDACDEVTDTLRERLPWQEIGSFTAFFDDMPPGANGAGLVARLAALTPRLEDIRDLLLEASADTGFAMSLPGGLIAIPGELPMTRADAFFLLSVVDLTLALIETIQAYDWGFDFRNDFGDGSELSDEQKTDRANDRFLVLLPEGGAHLEVARQAFSDAADALLAALHEAETAGRDDHAAPLAWGALSVKHIGELKELVQGFKAALSGWTNLPHLEPATTVNLSGYFTQPVNATDMEYLPFDYDAEWEEFAAVEGFFEELVTERFQPSIHEDTDEKSWQVEWYDGERFEPMTTDLLDRLDAAHEGCGW